MKPMIKNEDLKNVNGGGGPADGDYRCPKCHSCSFNYEDIGSGCDVECFCTCNDCGYQWIAE